MWKRCVKREAGQSGTKGELLALSQSLLFVQVLEGNALGQNVT